MEVFVSALAIHPVKSCRAIPVDDAVLLETGFAHDREWVVVDEGGRFISQRECPELARVAIGLQDDSLTLSEAGREPLSVAPRAPGVPRSVCIWRDTVSAFDQGEDAAQWLTSFLHRPARLMRFDRSNARYCDPQYAGESGAKTLFADGYPVLIVNEASLAELNGKMAQPLPITRFRPNVVLSGLDPFAEDYLESICVGDARLTLVKPCTRCQITTTDQETGAVGVEPLPTLARTRFNAGLGGVTFGVNAIVSRGAGTRLRRGSRVELTWRF